jgi:ketosteroid isomerase-like protein
MDDGAPRVDAVRRLFETGRRFVNGDRTPFEEAVRELCSEDLVVVPSSALASGNAGPYRGPEGLIAQQRGVAGRWHEFDIAPDEFVEVPPDTVVMLGKARARRGDGSGYAMELGIVSRFEDGLIVEIHAYRSKRRALEVAGAA